MNVLPVRSMILSVGVALALAGCATAPLPKTSAVAPMGTPKFTQTDGANVA
jgi:hypothetical protein